MISINYTDNKRSRLKIYGIIGAVFTLVIPFFLMLFNGNNHLETDQSLCPFKMLTGFPCPGCGITKSLVYLYEGDLYKSFSYHLFGPFAFLFCLMTIAVLSMELISGKSYFDSFFYNRKLAYGLGFFLAVYHLIRIVYFFFQNNFDAILHQSIWR